MGFLTGLFGVGGGFVIVPALALLLGLTTTEAVATSLVIVAINAASGLAAHAGAAAAADLDYTVIAVFAAAAMATSLAAGRIANKVPAQPLRRGFAGVVLTVAAGVAGTALLAPHLLTA